MSTSLIERKSRYTVAIKNCSRHSRPLIDKIVDAFSPQPAFARQRFTFDRRTEFRGFRALEEASRSVRTPLRCEVTTGSVTGSAGMSESDRGATR